MNRRQFLRVVLPGAAVAALLPPTIWTPKRTFFLAPKSGWPSDVWYIRILDEAGYENFVRLDVKRDNPPS